MKMQDYAKAVSLLPEPYASTEWTEITIAQYKEETLVLCHPKHPPLVYGTNIGWKDVKGNPLETVTIKEHRVSYPWHKDKENDGD